MKQHYIFIFIVLITSQLSIAQTPDWQWAKRGGSSVELSGGSEVYSTGLERVLDLVVDSNNNCYFLPKCPQLCCCQGYRRQFHFLFQGCKKNLLDYQHMKIRERQSV